MPRQPTIRKIIRTEMKRIAAAHAAGVRSRNIKKAVLARIRAENVLARSTLKTRIQRFNV